MPRRGLEHVSAPLARAVKSIDPNQIPTTQPCPYCGRAVQPLHELAELADLALHSLETRRLAVPSLVPGSLKTIANDLRCLAGACGGSK